MTLTRSAFALMLIAVLSKIGGFLREVVLAQFYGASPTTDAYLVALAIPGVLFVFISTAISVAFVPGYLALSTYSERSQFVGRMVGTSLTFCALIVLLVLAFAPSIVILLAPGFDVATHNLTVFFTRVSVAGIFFSALLSVFTGTLHAEGKLLLPAIAGLAFSVTVIISIVFGFYFGVAFLILGPVFAKALELLLMWPSVRRATGGIKPEWNLSDPQVRLVWVAVGPLALGIAANQVNLLVGRALASGVGEGGVSAMNYANHLSQFVVGVIALSIATSIFPRLAKMFQSGNFGAANLLIREGIEVVCFAVIPASVFVMFFSSEIVVLVFGRGKFDAHAVQMTANALFFYSFGMLAFALREVLARAFYAARDAKTAVNNAIIGVALNILLSLLLVGDMGLGGLAVATSVSGVVTTGLLLYSVKRKFGVPWLSDVAKEGLILIGLSLLCAIALLQCSRLLNFTGPIATIVAALLFFALVVCSAVGLKMKSALFIVTMLRSVLSKV